MQTAKASTRSKTISCSRDCRETKLESKRNRRTLVRRLYAERYLLITMASFTLSVSFTRLFLEIAGYPQLGGGELHIAHVLWGGMFLFTGSLLPLIFANKRALDLSALLSGIGVGLFIDEVGKFLTRTNDYFYPAAAPIVYIFFLLTLFIFTMLRRGKEPRVRQRLYYTLEKFEEVLEGDLSREEYEEIISDLQAIENKNPGSDAGRIAGNLLAVLESEEENLIAHQPDFLEKTWQGWLDFENRNFSASTIRGWLLFVWIISGVLAILHSILAYLYTAGQLSLTGVIGELLATSLADFNQLSVPAYIRFFGEGIFGFLLAVAALAALIRRERLSLNLAQLAQLANILFVNIFVFYYDQFSAIVFTLLQFGVLFITYRYRKNFLRESIQTG